MEKKNINVCILDYGSGNVKSVLNIVKSLTNDVLISNNPNDIKNATHLILPGVGAFGAAMKKIKDKLPLSIIETEIFINQKPILGICVGMQVFADNGYEYGEYKGLGWIPGNVTLMECNKNPLPHIGWNNIQILKENNIYSDLSAGEDFYFLHSYEFKCSNSDHIVATTNYEYPFSSIVRRENIFGVQFHPEKSQIAGRLLFSNFLHIDEKS